MQITRPIFHPVDPIYDLPDFHAGTVTPPLLTNTATHRLRRSRRQVGHLSLQEFCNGGVGCQG